jgi:hypothetical protein
LAGLAVLRVLERACGGGGVRVDVRLRDAGNGIEREHRDVEETEGPRDGG